MFFVNCGITFTLVKTLYSKGVFTPTPFSTLLVHSSVDQNNRTPFRGSGLGAIQEGFICGGNVIHLLGVLCKSEQNCHVCFAKLTVTSNKPKNEVRPGPVQRCTLSLASGSLQNLLPVFMFPLMISPLKLS